MPCRTAQSSPLSIQVILNKPSISLSSHTNYNTEPKPSPMLIKCVSCLYTKDKIDELGAVRPRFTRNLTGKCANLTSNFPQIPAPAIHWSVIRLADMGQSHPTSHVTHWARLLSVQAGQLLHNQSVPCLVCGTPCLAFVFLVELYRQTFAIYIFCFIPLIILKHLLIFLYKRLVPFIPTTTYL